MVIANLSKLIGFIFQEKKSIELSRYVSFEENFDCSKSTDSSIDVDLDVPLVPQNPPLATPNSSIFSKREDSPSPKIQDISEVGPNVHMNEKKRPLWARNIMQEAEKFSAPKGTFRESKRPQTFDNYYALMCKLIDFKPSCFESAIGQQVWKDAMFEEYESILKNKVWEVVPRPKDK